MIFRASATVILGTLLIGGCLLASSPAAFTSAGQEKGREQLARVLADCPQLRSVVQESNANWQWLVTALGDDSQGFEIRWTKKVSRDCENVTAESSAFPNDDHISYVRVDAINRSGPLVGHLRSPEEVMSGLVFELNNVRLGPEKRRIAADAATGRMGRQDYILACAHEEFTANQETASFYRSTWMPFCASHHLRTSPRLWYASLPTSFGAWISRFPATFWYPWGFFGDRYDRLYGKVSVGNH